MTTLEMLKKDVTIINNFIELYQEMGTRNRDGWVRITDGLPILPVAVDQIKILVYFEKVNNMTMLVYSKNFPIDFSAGISHWMYLPEPPKV